MRMINRYCHNNRSIMTDYHFRVAAELVQRAISGGLERVASERASKTVAWPVSEDFTVEKGQQAIGETVKGWAVSESWKHCIDYLGTNLGGEGHEDGLHCYRVQWSEPTRRKPVPVATASVYFFLREQHGKKCPVQPFYILEGQRLVHRPGRTNFQEVWLRNVIQQKLSVLQTSPHTVASN